VTKIVFEQGLWQAHFAYADREVLKAAGWQWQPPYKRWATKDLRAVRAAQEALADVFGEDLTNLLSAQERASDDRLRASHATDAPELDIRQCVPDGLDLMSFQRAGVGAVVARHRALLADEMGLGKTVQAIVAMNWLWANDYTTSHQSFSDAWYEQFLVVAPAGLLLNWEAELARWSYVPRDRIVLVSWSMLAKRDDVLDRPWYMVIVDEAHYAKDRGSQRTQALGRIVGRRVLALTGTPILNRPAEMFPLLSWLAPARWGTFWTYAQRYCDARRGRFGWDFSGASNVDELDDRLRRSVMVRRLKQQVLAELPPKVRQVIPLGLGRDEARLVKEEQAAFDAWQAAKGEGKLNKLNLTMGQLATARKRVALAKAPRVIEHVQGIVNAGEGPVVVFAHHLDVIDLIANGLKGRVRTYDGRTTPRQRDVIVKEFQAGQVDVLVGGILAAGVGLTLTAASVAVFAELDWVPANMAQAEDRLHRIGQTDSVLVQYIVYDGSIDNRVGAALARKQKTLDDFDGWSAP
jgi:SWI/SNF-related matrix-associated actin-dependent regulator of chromatin subfamily A-like protein 1